MVKFGIAILWTLIHSFLSCQAVFISLSNHWKSLEANGAEVSSYLVDNTSADTQLYFRKILKIIHGNQHPKTEFCSKKRLLILDVSSESFEGIGSILREVMIGLAIAVHSNRTLIWGRDTSMIFRLSGDLQQEKVDFNDKTLSLDCSDNSQAKSDGRGPYDCLFQSLSSCSLRDISVEEWKSVVENGYNESNRVMVNEIRKGMALYQPPKGLLEYLTTDSPGQDEGTDILGGFQSNEYLSRIYRHLWASAVAAYAFRLRPSVVQNWRKKHMEISRQFRGKDIGFRDSDKNKNSDNDNNNNNASTAGSTTGKRDGSVWGIHMRHGDLKAMSATYPYKRIFEVESYLNVAAQLSHLRQETPAVIHIATDSYDIPGLRNRYVTWNQNRGTHQNRWYSPIGELPHSTLDAILVPSLFVLDNEHRYRTPHGSHTVAAEGGCVDDPELTARGLVKCSMRSEDVTEYRNKGYFDERKSGSRAKRLLRVLVQSVEDLFSLSMGDVLIAQGSSYFSTVASMLMMARAGITLHQCKCRQDDGTSMNSCSSGLVCNENLHSSVVSNVIFLDQPDINRGLVPTGYLGYSHHVNLTGMEGGFNDERSTDNDRSTGNKDRWTYEMDTFLSGVRERLVESNTNTAQTVINPWSQENSVRIVDLLPQMSSEVFLTEAETWLTNAEDDYQPVWPGGCPGRYQPLQLLTREIIPQNGNFKSSSTKIRLKLLKQTMKNLKMTFPSIEKSFPVYVSEAMKLGLLHYNASHPGQALQCWRDGLIAVNQYYELFDGLNSNYLPDQLRELLVFATKVFDHNMNRLKLIIYEPNAADAVEHMTIDDGADRSKKSMSKKNKNIQKTLSQQSQQQQQQQQQLRHLHEQYLSEHLLLLDRLTVSASASSSASSSALSVTSKSKSVGSLQSFDEFFRAHQKRQNASPIQHINMDDVNDEIRSKIDRLQELKKRKQELML